MTTPDPDVREAAGRWLHDFTAAVRDVAGLVSWESGSEDDREYWRVRAEPFAAAVEPVIRRQERERVAEEIEGYAEAIGWYEGGGVWAEAIEIANGTHVGAAAIARSHSQHPEETNHA